MRENLNMKRIAKIIVVLAAGVLLLGLTACGSKEAVSFDRTTIVIEEDGSVSGTEVDVFDADLYNIEELKQMTTDAVEEYNSSGKGTVELVSVEELEGAQGQVRMVMHYDAPATYIEFNTPITRSKILYYGTVEQARTAGYPMDVPMTDVSSQTEMSREQVEALSGNMVLVTNETAHIRVPEKIAYFSEGVILSDNKAEADLQESATGLFYIVLKK